MKTKGVLKGVEISTAPDKSWKRASLKIEKDGKTITLSTFDEDDTKTANESNGMEIEAEYTLTQKGDKTYKNLVKGGLKAIGQGDIPVVEEVVDDEEEEPKKEAEVIMTESEGRKMGKNPPKIKNPPDTQRLIVRQNSLSQANKYIENIVKAVEVGILKPTEVDNTDLNIDNLKSIAHQIEEDIMR